jgi:hypothetical protein
MRCPQDRVLAAVSSRMAAGSVLAAGAFAVSTKPGKDLMRPGVGGAFGSEGLVAGEHVPDRFGQAAASAQRR